MKPNYTDLCVTVEPGETKRDAFMRLGRKTILQIDNPDFMQPIASYLNMSYNDRNNKKKPPEFEIAKALFEKGKEYYNKGFEEEIRNSENLAEVCYLIGLDCLSGKIDDRRGDGFHEHFYYYDYEGAEKYITKAAEMGDLEAMNKLSKLYLWGEMSDILDWRVNNLFNFCEKYNICKSDFMSELGISNRFIPNLKKAEKWLLIIYKNKEQILSRNDIMVQYLNEAIKHLGYIYLMGRDGIQKDENKAAEWLYKACDMSINILADSEFYGSTYTGLDYFRLAESYYYGTEPPIPQDYKRAYECYTKASFFDEDGSTLEQLSKMNANGYGVKKNDKLAKLLHEKAVSRRNEFLSKDPFSADPIELSYPKRHLRADVSMGPDGNYYEDGEYIPEDWAFDDD